MADDKSKRDSRDRRVSADDDYEVEYFAKKAGITPQVKDLIAKHGNNRATLEREAKAMGKR